MRGYCPKCREYRSDEGENAWGIAWTEYGPVCERCSSVIDVFDE